MVYAAELQGILIALLQTIRADTPVRRHLNPDRSRQVVVFIDNQAAIQACEHPGRSSGQYILRYIARVVNALREQGWEPHLQWIPSHEGVYDNEQADELARQTADAPVDANASTEPVLRVSQRQILRSHANEQWKVSWEFNGHGALLRRLFSEPTQATLCLHYGLRRAASSALVQMQTGKIALASYLGTFSAMETTDCSCG
ncbi:hypothetical protein SI65_08192 [Aspergillus cristatus]|uniref:RNase H type-1 domain-containing protein n=1 Tax=Aspergillus cristatus TaxID=573508 RepID=A0A1E3B5G4_ASPCR|nr:hypothetical protein SI65_08192 [Aspergillus cristatus]